MSKKGENIYKRKDGRWEARYIKTYRVDGTARYGYCYGKTYREAKQKASEAKAGLLLGLPSDNAAQRHRFSVYCDEWITLNRSRVKESTYVKYRGMLGKYVKPYLGDCRVQTLSSVLIEQFSHELLSEEELSPKTVKDILTMLHSVLKYTAMQVPELLSKIEVIYPKIPKKEARVLSREEQTRFVRFLSQEMDGYKLGILLSLLTGMRIGEVCALQWKNVFLQERLVTICATMQRLRDLSENGEGKTKITISEPKSNCSTRVIPLTDYALTLLQKYRNNDPEAFVLTGRSDQYIEPRLMQYHLERYTKACQLENVHFHTLRHTFATRCVEVNFEIKTLSEILGHTNPNITLERYVHSSVELKRANMEKLAAVGF